jgi:hypothetical protein
MLQTVSRLITEHTNSSAVGYHSTKLLATTGNYWHLHPGRIKQNCTSSSINWREFEVPGAPHLFPYHFESVKFSCAHPVYCVRTRITSERPVNDKAIGWGGRLSSVDQYERDKSKYPFHAYRKGTRGHEEVSIVTYMLMTVFRCKFESQLRPNQTATLPIVRNSRPTHTHTHTHCGPNSTRRLRIQNWITFNSNSVKM